MIYDEWFRRNIAAHFMTWMEYLAHIFMDRLTLIVYPGTVATMEPEFYAIFLEMIAYTNNINIYISDAYLVECVQRASITFQKYRDYAAKLLECK